MGRTSAVKFIHASKLLVMLVVGWQAVRFIMGDIGYPVVPLFEFVSAPSPDATGELPGSPLSSLVDRFQFQSIIAWGLGIAFWGSAVLVVSQFGNFAARVVQIGWQQYRAEQREAHEAARKAAQRQAAKDRRRELRRKVLEAREPRRGVSGVLPFALGVLFGSFFL